MKKFEPSSGSVAGGTRITIYGTEFGDMYADGIAVFVGSYPCTVIGHYSSSEVLTCETSAGVAGTYTVTVVVGGFDPVSLYGFTYHTDMTPTLKALWPRAGPPGSEIFLYGDNNWYLQWSFCPESTWGEVNCVGSIMFGDYLCPQDPEDPDSPINFANWTGYQRYGYNPYRVGCTLPAPETSNSLPALGTAGSFNATMRFEASLRGGSAKVLRSSYAHDVNGWPYHFQLYPEVANISPKVGSNAGGTLLKITGRGFPTLDLGLNHTVNVSVAGVPCAIVNSTYDTVFCVTGPKPVMAPESATPIRGLYAGMRGVEYEFYNTSSRTPAYNQLWSLNKTTFLNNTNGTGSYKAVLTGSWEDPHYTLPYHCTRMKAFFTAPRSANYRFHLQTDDYGQLNGTWIQNGIEVNRMLVNLTYYTYTDNYFMYSFQASAPIYLEAAQRILLESAHCNTYTNGHQQVAVRMEVPRPFDNSIAEVQAITVNANMAPHTVFVKFLYGAGANSTAFFVNVTSLDAARLEDPQMGLQLVFNDGAVSAVVPLTATGAQMDDIIEAAFGGQLAQASSNDLFGVRKIRSAGTLSLQIGINAVIGDSLGFDLTMAKLVTVSNQATSVNATNCTWVYPPRTAAAAPPPPPPALSSDNIAAGMMVTVTPAQPVPAVVPSGDFELSLPNSATPILLGYETNATVMRSAVYNLTGIDCSVTVTNNWREGVYFARVWTISFVGTVFDNVPNVVALRTDTMAPGTLMATEVRLANPPLTGSFKLAYGSYCDSVTIALGDTADTVRSKLALLPGMGKPRQVDVAGNSYSGYTYTITFDPFANPGDQPLLRAVDTSGLTGVSPVVRVAATTEGSTDAMYGPIPTEFLQLAVASPGSIVLSVNGAPSACAHPSGVCAFQYSDAATPIITSVSPSALSFDTETSLPLTITGTQFTAGVVNVTVGTAVCNVTSVTATQIVCSVSDRAPAGVRLVSVNVAGLGNAAGATNITLETLYVTGTTPAPAVVAAAGVSIFNITGKGFDSVDCANNKVYIDNVPSGVLACGRSFATVMYPGNGGTDVQSAGITAQVYEASRLIDQDSPASPTIRVSGAAPSIMGVTSPAVMPGAGGQVTLSLAGAAPADVTAMFMVPKIASPSNFTAASAAYAARLPCRSVTAAMAGTGVSCTAPPLPNGYYHVLVVLSSGLQLLSSDTILFDLVINSVTPNRGSIGGGTVLTIRGSGFSLVPAENVVFLEVPVSTTFLNGIIQCKTINATSTVLTCVTIPHLAADASSWDPMAKSVMPVATVARPVSVVICDAAANSTVLREYCWSLASSPHARIDTNNTTASCDFGYAEDLTPSIGWMGPTKGSGGQMLGLGGSYMADVTTVQLMQSGTMKGLCTDVFANATNVTCTLSDLPSGVYNLLLKKDNGEMSVDPYSTGIFTYTPTITALDGNAGSLVGGRPLTLSVGGSGLDANLTNNAVSIAGLPCPIISMDSRYSLTCRAPGMNGYVYAEYWNLGVGTYSLPDLITYTNPDLVKLEKGVFMDWNSTSPQLGVIRGDFWGARFTFYLQVMEASNVSFYINVDDSARLYVDDVYKGNAWTGLNNLLTAGIHKVVVTYAEWTGLASIRLYMAYLQSNGYMSGWQVPEWQKVTPVPPSQPLNVKLTVNGVVADNTCPPSDVQLQLPYQPELAYESSQVHLPNNTCAYVYTTHRTPTLTAVKGALGGLSPASFNNANASVSIYGNFFLDPNVTAASQLDVTVLNQTCVITDVGPFQINTTTSVNTTNPSNNSIVTLTWTNTTTITRINCTLPAVPVGTWPVRVMVAGVGYARPPATTTTDLPVITYSVRVSGINNPTLSTTGLNVTMQCYLSLFGGGTLNISGYGFVRGLVDPVIGRNMTANWEPSQVCAPNNSPLPTCQAAMTAMGQSNFSSALTLTADSCDGFNAIIRLSRIAVPNPQAYAANGATRLTLQMKPRVYYTYTNSPQYEVPAASTPLYLCGARTPALSNIAPASMAPDTGASGSAQLTLTWYMSGVGSNIVQGTAAGLPSNATVEFEVGPTVIQCANPVVTDSVIKATNYTESITCTLPRYLPAASYTLWLCIQPFGCGQQAAYEVSLSVNSATPLLGSSAGGILVTITGNGFDTNVSRVAVRFGSSVCNVTSSTGSTLTCLTGPLATRPDSPVSAPLSITPTIGAVESTFTNLMFTFDPALESTVSSITPGRGSTEGGTPVTITGADFAVGVSTTVTVGGTPCSSVVVVSSTAITCVTGKPPSTVLRVPLPVTVSQTGRGLGRGNVSYQYIDLWSRNSTWGGGPLPGFEDSVVIPPGVTVLLDMSPPKLYTIVLQGNLIFDETQPYLNLQAHYILVVGGNFSIGTVEKPFPGRANITMHGPPNSRDLPMYGAKSIAVRKGVVTFHGLPKIPHYTTLNQTVDKGSNTIVLNGFVNWEVGDKIVIASSSFYPNETTEAAIVAVDTVSIPGCSVLTLDTPARFDHLGVIHSQPGVNATLDMRAEVGVLTRNVVLQGDYTSEKNMYGVQLMVYSPPYMPRALIRFDNIEVTQSGQAYRLGRYSLHWHIHGDVNFQSWVRGCAIHHTYNRATTIHGTHRTIYQNNLAYNTMGHTFFMEDGNEWGNIIEGNIGIYTQASYALLITDTTPATFWITNPNNTVRNNRAAGSEAYGYWYRFLDNPEGPGYSSTVCPKFTPIAEFNNNTAHSNIHYGLRIHPEYYPRNSPCSAFSGTFAQEPAVFSNLVAYKNGVKGAVGTQLGLVQFINFTVGDNGGGPKHHPAAGKDHGGDVEMSWIIDDRNRYDVRITEMAGLVNATIFARTTTGNYGTAGRWPSDRRVAGFIAQSPLKEHPKHSALLSVINVTFVDFAESTGSQFFALEHCGKCKTYQGGATSFMANISFVNSDGSLPKLSYWSWGHQGIFLDTDGTLLNNKTLPASYLPTNWTLGPGTTWHSSVDSQLFDPAECSYTRGNPEASAVTGNDGAICSSALTFRRVMLNNHGPEVIFYRPLWLVSLATNRSSLVYFTKYNEMGYQFTVAVNRDYWVHWNMDYRIDPEYYLLHKMDLMDPKDSVRISTKHMQRKDHFTINDRKSNLTDVPAILPSTPHGSFYYEKNFTLNTWWWGNFTYNDTKLSVHLAGRTDSSLSMDAYACPDEGCNTGVVEVIDIRNDTLYWSNATTWVDRLGGKPQLGENVTIPYGWNLVIDESPPALSLLVVQGNVTFDPTRDVTLTATYILVVNKGVLRAGTPSVAHPTKATISLAGTRSTPDFAIDNQLNLGSKVLAAFRGGSIELHGRKVNQRWVRLNARAAIGDTSITVSDPNHGWRVGDKIIITSTSYNVWQSEMRNITEIKNGGLVLVLDAALEHPHGSTFKAYPGGPTVDQRAEVGMLSSNVLITSVDGASSHAYGSEFFGARVVVSGNGTGRLTNMAMEYCGQAGFTDRACVFFDRLANVWVPANTSSNDTNIESAAETGAYVKNPSVLHRSALVWGMNSNVRIGGLPGKVDPVSVTENVMYEAFDMHSVMTLSSGNIIKGNLVLGTIKDMSKQSSFDTKMPSQFYSEVADNWVENNVAAGGERYGFSYFGVPCSEPFLTGSFLNNTAHSNLAGLWLLASDGALWEGCAALRNFTTYMNWDFGIISTRGILTDVVMTDVNVMDNKHVGVLILRKAQTFYEKASLWWRGGMLVGRSSQDVADACQTLSDIGCHKKLSAVSYNRAMPFTPSIGLQAAMFALHYADGPEPKPWDLPKGYSIAHGMFNISGLTLADFQGPEAYGGQATYAFANHFSAPDAFYPHFFSKMNVLSVATGPGQGMFYHYEPDSKWRNEGDCWDTYYQREDGSQLAINCAGPAHVYWRDLDGSLLAGGDPAGAGTISGVFKNGPRAFPMDQGPPVLPGACTYSSIYQSYYCVVNSENFLLDQRMKPNPIPPNGIYGDPQHFVMESRDKDNEDRYFAPVFFNVSGSIDLAVSTMDQGCCFGYGFCQKRLSAFWTQLPSGQTVYVNFTGTPSQVFRLYFPYADPNAEIVLVINMMYTLNRRFVYIPAGNGPVTGRVPMEKKPVKIGDGTGHGAHYWDQDNSLLYVKMTGGKILETRTENAVIISQTFAISINEFYDTKELFLNNLASAMGIDAKRMYFAEIKPGSVALKTAIGPKWENIGPLEEKSYGSEIDQNAPLPPAPPPPPPQTVNAADQADMVDAVKAYVSAVTSPDAAAKLGVQPLGSPVADLSALSAQDPLLAAAIGGSLASSGMTVVGATGSSYPPPPNSPPPPPSGSGTPSTNPTPNTTPSGTPPSSNPSNPSPPPASSSNPSGSPSGNPSGNPSSNPTSGTSNPPPPVVVTPGAPGSDPTVDGLPDRVPSPSPSPGAESSKKGLSGKTIGGIIAAVVGACALAGIAAAGYVYKNRSKWAVNGNRRQPGSSEQSYSQNEVLPSPTSGPGTVRGSNGSNTSAREAFMSTNPAYEAPASTAQAASESVIVSPRPSEMFLTSPRPGTGSGAATPRRQSALLAQHDDPLAAGLTPAGTAEVIRPLASTSKHPHSTPLLSGSGGPSRLAPPEVYHRGRTSTTTKTPAELEMERSASAELGRNTAADESGFRSSANATDRPGSARPATRNPELAGQTARRVRLEPLKSGEVSASAGIEEITAEDAAAIAATAAALNAAPNADAAPAAAPADEAPAATGANGETLVTPVQRTLETQESYIPRPRSRHASVTAANSRSSSAAAPSHPGAATADAAPEAEEQDLPGPPAPEATDTQERRPTMMLPGGLLEFAATPSLLRSEVAAMLLSAGDGAQGFEALEEALQEAETAQQQQAGAPQARSPAGLYSESMRKRVQPDE